MWHINLCLSELCTSIPDLATCTQVALKRTNGKPILLKVAQIQPHLFILNIEIFQMILEAVKQPKPPLDKLQESFNHINNVYRECLEAELQSHTASPPGAPYLKSPPLPRVQIDQMDMYNEIFQKLEADKDLGKLEWTLISYMTSLFEQGIPAQHNLNELLITTLVKRKKFTALQQLLQYGVVSDSKPLACLLLSLGNLHPAATQLALDMLARLNATEEMQEILLSEGQVLSALKLGLENANPRKFLQAAQSTGDDGLFHSVLYYFKNTPQFSGAFTKG